MYHELVMHQHFREKQHIRGIACCYFTEAGLHGLESNTGLPYEEPGYQGRANLARGHRPGTRLALFIRHHFPEIKFNHAL